MQTFLFNTTITYPWVSDTYGSLNVSFLYQLIIYMVNLQLNGIHFVSDIFISSLVNTQAVNTKTMLTRDHPTPWTHWHAKCIFTLLLFNPGQVSTGKSNNTGRRHSSSVYSLPFICYLHYHTWCHYTLDNPPVGISSSFTYQSYFFSACFSGINSTHHKVIIFPYINRKWKSLTRFKSVRSFCGGWHWVHIK